MMSANAPLGIPSSNTGRLEAVCTNAINVAEVVSEVIVHAAATSFIHMQILATNQTDQSDLKTPCFNGDSHPSVRGVCISGLLMRHKT
jgi:hypothetical protein